MTRKEVYISMLQAVVDMLPANTARTDLQDLLDLDKIDEVCNNIEPLISNGTLERTKYLVAFIKHNQNALQDDITDTNPFSLETVDLGRKVHLHSFVATTPDFVILPASYLYDERDKYGNQPLCRAIERVWQHIKDDANAKNLFFSFFEIRNDEKYYLIRHASLPDNAWKIYSGAYMKHVASEAPQIPDCLKYTDTSLLPTTFSIQWANSYEQYHDIYNIIMEMRTAKDILSRFLKMYQILELMAYRSFLVKFAEGQITRNSFISNVKGLSKQIEHGERKSFKDALEKIMPNVNRYNVSSLIGTSSGRLHKLSDYLIQNYKNKYLRIYDADFRVNTTSGIADIIYTIRCSIVHSKECELHFTFGNISEYESILPMMKLLIKVMERKIIEVINNTTNQRIDFMQEKMGLY